MSLYLITNAAVSGAAQQVGVTTGTAIKTMLQVKLGLTATKGRVVEWGVSFEGEAAATPHIVELIETSLAATVTAHVAAGIAQLDPQDVTPTTGNPFTFTTITTGYTASSENAGSGTFRPLDVQYIAPTNQYIKQWPLGREPILDQAKYLRVRVTTAAAELMVCYVVIEIG